MNPNNHWKIDKQIPIALIVTIVCGGLLHTGSLVYWGATVNERLHALERATEQNSKMLERLTRVEVVQESQKDQLNRQEAQLTRIENKLDRVMPR